jgi:hypothetical protein
MFFSVTKKHSLVLGSKYIQVNLLQPVEVLEGLGVWTLEWPNTIRQAVVVEHH